MCSLFSLVLRALDSSTLAPLQALLFWFLPSVSYFCHSHKAVFSYRHSIQHDNQQNWEDIGVSGNTSKINVCTRSWEIYLYCPSVGSILSESLSAVHPWGSKIEELQQIRTSEISSFCVYSSLFVSPSFFMQKLPLVLLRARRESMIKVNNGEFHALHIANVTASGLMWIIQSII